MSPIIREDWAVEVASEVGVGEVGSSARYPLRMAGKVGEVAVAAGCSSGGHGPTSVT